MFLHPRLASLGMRGELKCRQITTVGWRQCGLVLSESRDMVVGWFSSATSGCLIPIEKLSGQLPPVGCKTCPILSGNQGSQPLVKLVLCLCTGETNFGQTRFGQTSFSQTSFGQTSFSQTTFGQTTFGQTTFGQTTFGPTTFGQTTFGQTNFG